LVRFDAFQNPISCRKSRDMSKCQSEANMPKWNFNSLKHVHTVIFISMPTYWLFSSFYPIP